VIFQSEFNKNLTEKYFGKKDKSFVIHNGTCLNTVNSIKPLENEHLDKFSSVWSCASSWRPHKRLKDNIDYFLEFSPHDCCLVVAGENPDVQIVHPRIFYAGDLLWKDLISLYRRSSKFIHLAWLDHCPNVVIDARAAGCQIVCSSAGGTREIAGEDSIIIKEETWDFSPVQLYRPPEMNFSNTEKSLCSSEISIEEVSKMYVDVFNQVLK